MVTREKEEDEPEKKSEKCRYSLRVCLLLLSMSVICGLYYIPMKVRSQVPFPENLFWMVRQRDLNRYILPENDTHLLLPKSQCNGSVFLTVIVCSSVPNFNARQAIRQSWAQDSTKLGNIQVYFLLGKSHDDSFNSLVANESQMYMDIVQEDFIDTYNNLTLKSVMLLKWVNQYCANAKYVMKTDDDMFVHLPNLYRLLKTKGHSRMLLGYLMEDAVPEKDRNSKWFVPDAIFSEKFYPPYLTGTGYVMSRDTIPLLYKIALNTSFFFLEDIFITGICARQAGLKPLNNEGFKYFKRGDDNCIFKFIITAHGIAPKELVEIWNNLQDPSFKCEKRYTSPNSSYLFTYIILFILFLCVCVCVYFCLLKRESIVSYVIK